MSYRVVVLSDSQEIRLPLIAECKDRPLIVSTQGDEKFCFARNANRGFAVVDPDDVILCNDDVRLIQPDTFGRMADLALSSPTIGIAGAMVRGGVGNPFQDERHVGMLWHPDWKVLELSGHGADVPAVCFVCVYLKRRMIDEIGPLDETFTGYGWDDNDYCIRARRAGWKTVISRDIVVQHGDGTPTENGRGKSWSTSFARENYPDNTPIFMAKYGLQAKSA